MAILEFQRDDPAESQSLPPVLDPSQSAVIQLPDGASAAVIGAPGSGKTTTLIELVANRVLERGWATREVLALGPNRAAATRLRDVLAIRLGVATAGPLARTANSLAFDILTQARRSAGAEPPRLLTGGDQDSDFSQLLDGHLQDGRGPAWPELLAPEVRRLRGFRTELRELVMRCTEYGVSPAALRDLGRRHDRPEWIAAADFIAEYLQVISSARPDQVDSAELMRFAAVALEAGNAGETVSALRLVVVDDLQEATASTIVLLRALAARGIAVIAFGDPDVATNAFRGGEPDVLGRLAGILDRADLVTLHLRRVHRHGPALRALTRVITDRIGTAGIVGHRAAISIGAARQDAILRIEAPTPARESASIARLLRERHLIDGIEWRDMAVIVRGGGQVPAAARALALAGVPTRTAVGGRALRDDRAARALLTVVDVGIGRTPLTPALATEMLLGPFGGLDRLTLRRLRLALRAEELAGGGNRSSDELLSEGLAAAGRFATIDARVARNAGHLAKTLAEIGAAEASGGSIEELLWLAWQRSGLADSWRQQALGAGIGAAEASGDLDGVLALFTAAKRFVERRPGIGAGVFLDGVLDAEVPEDTLSPQPVGESVLVTTPSGAVGLEVDVVVVAGLQDGVWPNLRLRGSLLHPQELVRAATGRGDLRIDARKEVLDDELRMFALAVSRARRQVILAAVSNDDEAASILFGLVPADARVIRETTPFSLRALTGRLRRELVGSGSGLGKQAAASALARLAGERVPGADPAEWHGLLDPSSLDPLYGDDDIVPVSPSKLESFEESPLDWFIESVSGTAASTAMGLGTIVHWAMETATDPGVDAIWAAIESRWSELVFESPWLGEQQRRAARILAAGVAEYLGDFSRDGKTLVGAERRFSLAIGTAVLNGSIDRVERTPDGGVVIVDLKTGSPITRQDAIDGHPQLGAYQLAYADGVLDEFLDELGAHHAAGAKLLYVKKGKAGKLYREGVQAALDAEQLEGFRTRIRQAAVGMAAAQFPGAVELSQWGRDTLRRRLHRVRAVSSD